MGGNVGYGAINMGIGFERTGGQLYSVEIDPRNVRTARRNLEAVALSKTVTVIEGDALKVLPALEGEIDFIFLNALKEDRDTLSTSKPWRPSSFWARSWWLIT